MEKSQITEELKEIIEASGYEMDETAGAVLNFIYEQVIFEIKTFCNIAEVGECLKTALINMCLGYFWADRHKRKYLTASDEAKILKSISEGDISLAYEVEDVSEAFKEYYNGLINRAKASLIHFRRLVW